MHAERLTSLGSKMIQLYGWKLYYISLAEKDSWFIVIAAVNVAVKVHSAERHDYGLWWMYYLREGPKQSVCLPLWKWEM